MSRDVVARMRAMADAPWIARGDAATQAALREGADEVDELRRELAFTRRQREGDGDLIRRMSAEGDEYIDRNKALRAEVERLTRQSEGDSDLIRRLFAEVAEYVDRLDAAQAVARGAQYREREARNEAAMLRAALDGAQGVAEVQRACAVMQAAIATIALDRWRRADAEIAALRAQAQPDAGDLAGLGARAVR